MKKFIYALAALLAVSVTSCKDDDTVFSPSESLDRLPMTMFRKNHNTNVSQNTDPYGTRVVEGTRNSIQLYWYGVEGAAGYEIRYAVATGVTSGLEEDWSNPEKLSGHFTVGPDVLHYRLDNLSYSTDYRFSIRALHPDGVKVNGDQIEVLPCDKHSKWYGMGSSQEWEDWVGVTTDARYVTPGVIFASDKDYDAFNVYIDLKYDSSKYSQADQDTIAARYDIDADGNFVAQTLYLMPDAVNPEAATPFRTRQITSDDLERGYIRIEGLDRNSVYVVRLRNENVPVEVDSYYNDITMRTKGDPGAPIYVKHSVGTSVWVNPEDLAPNMTEYNEWFAAEQKYQACLLDTLFNHYANNPKQAEGQVFYLDGDKVYYTRTNIDLNKGFTLETDPEQVKEGKRAKVYLGGITGELGSTKSNNFMFGKALGTGEVDAPIQVESVIFRNIDFDCPLAHNFGDINGTGQGNYFANMYSNGRGVEFESIEFENCTFQRMIRGFIRTQGSKVKKFHKLSLNNCLFFNMGYYKNTPGGYAWFAGELSSPENNIFEDFIFTNNTIYDCPNASFLTHGNNSGYDQWSSDHHYKMTITNNTFINFCTRGNKPLFDFRSFPGGSTIIFRNNLISLAADGNDNTIDQRSMNNQGADLRGVYGDGSITLDFGNNYSTGCRDYFDESTQKPVNHFKDDGIFSAGAFSATKNSFGSYIYGLLSGDRNDLVVKVGENPLRTDELFNSPNPRYHQVSGVNNALDHKAPDNIYEALMMKTDSKVTSHEIWINNVGDPRWRQSDPKNCYNANYAPAE